MNQRRINSLAAAIALSLVATGAQAAGRTDLHKQDLAQLKQLTERQAPPDLVASCLARARLEIGARLDPDADPGDTAARLVDGARPEPVAAGQ